MCSRLFHHCLSWFNPVLKSLLLAILLILLLTVKTSHAQTVPPATGRTPYPQITDADANRIEITNISDGHKLSGNTIIRFTCSKNAQGQNFSLILDGHLYRLPNLSPPAQQFKVENEHSAICFLHTDYFPNGKHTITVVDDQGHQDERDVIFSNTEMLPRFKILNIYDGSRLSGTTNFDVAVFDGSFAEDIDMWLDGHDYGPSNAYLQPAGYSIETQDVNTNRFLNGQHDLAIMDAFGNSDRRSVYFDNVISDVHYEVLCQLNHGSSSGSHIDALINPSQKWRVEIQDLDHRVVRSFHGYGNKIDVFWNGKDDHEQLAPEGLYSLIITALTSNKHVVGSIDKHPATG